MGSADERAGQVLGFPSFQDEDGLYSCTTLWKAKKTAHKKHAKYKPKLSLDIYTVVLFHCTLFALSELVLVSVADRLCAVISVRHHHHKPEQQHSEQMLGLKLQCVESNRFVP